MNTVGFTTTIPLEVLIAAKKIPLDLNNAFISHPMKGDLLKQAERDGFPRNVCAWIKGIYAVALQNEVEEIIAVTQGDCSNTQALMETLELKGIRTVPFFYPYDRDLELLSLSMQKLMLYYGVSNEECLEVKNKLDGIRKKIHHIDRLTWKENLVSGFENHYFLVSTTDMQQDCTAFEREVDRFLLALKERQPYSEEMRIGYIGVPPIFNDLYSFIESLQGRVVFNEIQRQFSMPYPAKTLLEQYRKYTYPYSIFSRIEDIKKEISRRKIDGIIHYVQSFCFRQIENAVFKKNLPLPVLTIEGDQPSDLDSRNKMKVEVFIEMLRSRKER